MRVFQFNVQNRASHSPNPITVRLNSTVLADIGVLSLRDWTIMGMGVGGRG